MHKVLSRYGLAKLVWLEGATGRIIRRYGYAYLHNAVDDHSRLAYRDPSPMGRRKTAAGFWEHANTYFKPHPET